jgi:hypothetical protein
VAVCYASLQPLTRWSGKQPLALLAAVVFLLVCTGRASAGYIAVGNPDFATDDGMAGSTAPSPLAVRADGDNPGPGSPGWPAPPDGPSRFRWGLLSTAPVAGETRTSGSSSGSGSGAPAGLCRATTVLPHPQFVSPLQAGSELIPPPGPVSSIFRPPRVSI